MSEIIKVKKGKCYLKTPEGLEKIGEIEGEFDVVMEPNKNYLPALFPQLAEVCKHHSFSYNIDHQVVDACHHPNNIPIGCSWGECRPDVCPVWSKKE